MAVMFPDSSKRRVVFPSKAEEKFYNVCRTNLPQDWRVYHSVTLSKIERDRGMVDNEADFVLYHPKFGLIIVEVKGGRVGYDGQSGRYYSINRFGEKFTIKNPFDQVLVWKNRFVRYLRGKGVKLPVSYAVCFPTVSEDEFTASSSLEPEIIIGRSRMENLGKALAEIARKSHPDKFFDFPDQVDTVDDILRGFSFTSKLYLKDYLNQHEGRVKDIETVHETLITPIMGSPRLGIEGEAGTGKTMLAMMLADRFHNEGKRVALLSTNPILNIKLRDYLGDGIDVMTYAELASNYGVELLRRPSDFEGSRDDWIQIEGPARLIANIENASMRYDVILCDEAQDVQPFWWEAIEKAIPGDGRLYIFFDRSQGVFGSGGSDNDFVPEDVLPVPSSYFPLVHNYRTTREIGGFSRRFRTGNRILKSHHGRMGFAPQIIRYKDAQDARNKLKILLSHLLDQEKLCPEDVTVLSARRPFHDGSFLAPNKTLGDFSFQDLGLPHSNTDLKSKIPISTIAGFKGLETSVGVVINLSEYNLPLTNPIMSSLFYVACTRAKHMLYVMVQQDDPKEAILHEALAKLSWTGTMVLGGDSGDFEFSGVVTHFNPNRIGWVKVEDPSYEHNTVMFFPTDIPEDQRSLIRVGDRIKFRPKAEGPATIATQLKRISTEV